jgi:hypothetical protein
VCDIGYWHLADNSAELEFVRYWGSSGPNARFRTAITAVYRLFVLATPEPLSAADEVALTL